MALRTHRLMTQVTSASCLLLGLFGATSSVAAVTQPDGSIVPIPQSESNDYFDTRRYNETTLGIQSLLNVWEGTGNIDAYTEGSSSYVVFSPLCGLKGSMILRGGSCQVDFGWYCTDDAPGAEVIYPLVTQADIVKYHDVALVDKTTGLPSLGSPPAPLNQWQELQNNDKGFVPTVQSGYLLPVKGSGDLAAVRETEQYKACRSGKIGFAFKGNETTICPMSKFSEPSRNQMSTYGEPWINAVVYQSKRYPGTFYMAFEDMPTSASSFTPALSEVKATFPKMKNSGSGWESWSNDGDFNDFVFKVEGILCEGGGQPCTPADASGVPLLGACSLGVTACSETEGEPGKCMPKIQPKAESCNGWDDDCNGVADDGEGLCEENFVCDNGKCVGSCGSPEFPCIDGLVCENTGRLKNYCVSEICRGVECPEGQRCDDTSGQCVGGCEGVKCQDGMECIAGTCVDLCAGVECSGSFVCERGACIPNCTCLPCDAASGKSYCDTVSGRCIDPACASVVCPAFQSCAAGDCVNPCDANPCGTSKCTVLENGSYTCEGSTSTGTGTGTGTGTVPSIGLGTGAGTSTGAGASTGNPVVGAGGNGLILGNDEEGCGCRVAGTSRGQRGALLLALFGLATTALRLRRRGTRN